MPPRCCTFLQIHTILNSLSLGDAAAYREKFEEWITPVKTYCPAPGCSAFVSERQIPQPAGSQPKQPPLLATFLKEIIKDVQKSSSARFFRGEQDITRLPGYSNVIERPIDLSKISANIALYDSVNSLTSDIQLLAHNAVSYNGPSHPVSKAAEELQGLYLRSLSLATQRLLDTAPMKFSPAATFPCPRCHIAICSKCKQIEHGTAPCDTSSEDAALAMLQSFGYKRCPRCKAGVKKMFGCSHMQCLCGAHWCYWCQRSIEECDGACAEREEMDDEDGDEYDSELDNDDGEVAREIERRPPPAETGAAPGANSDVPVNLDAGGYMRWAEREGLDFGDEPEEEGHMQVWSCKHRFALYRVIHEDAFDRGDYLEMECNRCATSLTPRKPSMSTRTIKSRVAESSPFSSFGKWVRTLSKGGEPKGEPAWECEACRIVTCEACKRKYEEDRQTSA